MMDPGHFEENIVFYDELKAQIHLIIFGRVDKPFMRTELSKILYSENNSCVTEL